MNGEMNVNSKLFDAEARSLRYLNQLNELEIPFFQRPYVWEEENWEKLYNSFFENDIPDFLGSIILKHSMDQEQQTSIVIDGQQRLTTISLFVKAIYDNLNITDKSIYKPHLEQILYRYLEELNENGEPIVVPRLKHSLLDKKSFDLVMNNFDGKEIEENKNDRIISCYKYFHNRLKKETYENMLRIIKLLLSTETTIFVGIIVYSHVDEQKVFDTLNNAGVRLTLTDTIKNYLFSKVSKVISGGKYTKEVIDLYDKYWNATFNTKIVKENNAYKEIDIRKYWEKEVNYGRITRNVSDLFLQSYATIIGFYKPEDTIDNLANKYKEKIDRLNTREEIESFIKNIKEYGDVYFEHFIEENGKIYSYSKNEVLKRLLLIVRTIDFETLNPYILYILVKYKNDFLKQNELLHYVEKLVLITYLSHNTSRSKNYNKLCVDFIEDNNRIQEELKNIENPKKDCLDGLYKINEQVAKMLLFLIEIYRRANKFQDIKELEFLDTYQLEHIMPKKWQSYWNWLPEEDEKGQKIEQEEDKEKVKDRIIKSLGNMTLLNGSLNNHIKNNAIDIKINGKKTISQEQKGIRDYIDLKITKEDVVDYYDNNKTWEEKHIIERNKNLLEEIINAFMY